MAIYHDMPDADYRALYQDHLSVSGYKWWLECGAARWEEEAGTWKRPEKDCFLEGRFAHLCLFQPELLPQFQQENPEIISTRGEFKGGLKSEFRALAEIANLMRADDYWHEFAGGEPEVSITGEIDGVLWCARVDSLHVDRGLFDDAKFMKNFKPAWKGVEIDGGKRICVSWYEQYWVQIAVYKHLLEQNFPGKTFNGRLIASDKPSDKDKPPCRVALDMSNQEKIDEAMWQVRDNQKRIVVWRQEMLKEVRNPELMPTACGNMEECPYCRKYSNLRLRKAV